MPCSPERYAERWGVGMRKLYENIDTTVDEVEFFQSLREHAGYSHYTFSKLPLGYEIECAMESYGSITGWCEFKRRHVDMNKYPTLILSLHKYKQLISYSFFDDGAMLFVRWNDKDAVHHVPSEHIKYDIAWGGRSDRGDWQDAEPVVHIPIKEFVVLSLEREKLSEAGRDRLGRMLSNGKPWTVGAGDGR